MDIGSLSCGLYQIKETYWNDCYRPGDCMFYILLLYTVFKQVVIFCDLLAGTDKIWALRLPCLTHISIKALILNPPSSLYCSINASWLNPIWPYFESMSTPLLYFLIKILWKILRLIIISRDIHLYVHIHVIFKFNWSLIMIYSDFALKCQNCDMFLHIWGHSHKLLWFTDSPYANRKLDFSKYLFPICCDFMVILLKLLDYCRWDYVGPFRWVDSYPTIL